MQRLLFLKLVLARRLLSPCFVKERLQIEFLAQAQQIHNLEIYKRKLVKLRTKLWYSQSKFNLLREASEG